MTNENLLARCVAQDVYFTATDSTLTACQFQTFSNALHVTQNRVIELEGENSRLLEKIQKDDHDNMVKHFSKLEVENINLQLKIQHLEEKLKKPNNKTSWEVSKFNAHTEIRNRDEQIQAHMNTIRKLKVEIAQLKSLKSDRCGNLNPKFLDSQNFQFQNTINILKQDIDWF